MKLWLLEDITGDGHDRAAYLGAFVIRASTPGKARQLAADFQRGLNAPVLEQSTWLNMSQTRCHLLADSTIDGDERVVLHDAKGS